MEREGDSRRISETLRQAGLESAVSRRGFLQITTGTLAGLAAMRALAAAGEPAPLIIMAEATGMIIADPARCVGCQRCELACTEFNDGRSQPSMARIKVSRNLNYGPGGALAMSGQGLWGNSLVIQDTCKQCAHPVPCATTCPQDAIVVDRKTKARVVDAGKCVGCRLCQKACPWDMMSFDEEAEKATKCFLCNGSPKCVESCPADALHFVPWRNVAATAPRRTAPFAVIPAAKAATCITCHQ